MGSLATELSRTAKDEYGVAVVGSDRYVYFKSQLSCMARAIRLTSCFVFLLRVANDVSRSLAAKAMTDFKVKAVLGVGAFGKVLLCRHPDSKGVFAVKQLSKAQIIAAQLQHHVRQERYERESLSIYIPTCFHPPRSRCLPLRSPISLIH